MRVLVLLALFANLFLLAYGQGFFNTAPSELGKSYTPKPFFNHADIRVDTLTSSS